MTVSLREPHSLFHGVRLKQLKTLMMLASSENVIEIDRIRRQFGERAANFEATLDFLILLRYVRRDGDRVILRSPGLPDPSNANDFAEGFIDRLMGTRSACRTELLDYFKRFCIEQNAAVYYPTTEQRTAESALRNVLMELGVITHEVATDSYRINPPHFPMFCRATRIANGAPLTSSSMDKQLQARHVVGTDAEFEILSFERRRLGAYADRVVHIAPLNQGAGYDIESITLEDDSEMVPRFIEVKAVSPDTRRFFWTANEVATAKRLGPWYYLYLLPTKHPDTFDVNRLQIIPNPIESILGDQNRWRTTPDVFRCELAAGSDESGLMK